MEHKRINSISEFHRTRGLPPSEHPLISVIDYSRMKRPDDVAETNWVFGFYQIALKRGTDFKMKYGQQEYDFDEGVMLFIAPNQVLRLEPEAKAITERSGWMLLIHPDFLWNTPLAKTIKQYGFFDYSANEALFLSAKEEIMVNGIIQNIEQEYHSHIDDLSQQIIISQIETLLNYAERFYRRQFVTRKITSHNILDKLEHILNHYFDNNRLSAAGLPTVQCLAEELNMSSKYLSTLLKVLTGQTAQQHIHEKLIEKAKEKLSITDLTVGEIAYQLGFEHPQSFSKLFKAKTQLSPLEFRQAFN